MLNHDNLDEYRDAEIYDVENGRISSDLNFYRTLAQKTGGPILELACGTGRMTIPLAEDGFEITGVDITPEMIRRARMKAEEKSLAIDWIVGDCREIRLNQSFRFAFMTGNAFQAFLDRPSQEAMLKTVHNHLHASGVFAFETRNPNLASLASGTGEEEEWGHFVDSQGLEFRVSERRRYDPITQIEHYVTYRKWADKTTESRISIRYTFAEELESLLYYNGFELLDRHGYFDDSPLTAESPLMVCICRKR